MKKTLTRILMAYTLGYFALVDRVVCHLVPIARVIKQVETQKTQLRFILAIGGKGPK
jgi:hypothetical protein